MSTITQKPDALADSETGIVTFADVANVYLKWMKTSDLGPLQFALGLLVANHYDADPCWGIIVGGPGGGKSETLRALKKIPRSHQVSTITESALMSGVSRKDRSKTASGGLLKTIGRELGFIVLKDFGGVLSMARDPLRAVMQAFREIYDGAWTRYVGSDGGTKLGWHGKIGLLCGATSSIDSHQGAMASLGERFLYFRLKSSPDDRAGQGEGALELLGRRTRCEKNSRTQLANVSPLRRRCRQFVTC